ncbi:GFA family protein [Bosea sp. F3-2]|uniref:GFA family protein n=1 Tax=Bosea sp. F3-2 TaxID=2599640 RepID=UPI0011EF0AE4|nr:GFA family protein [Bosea sp. F3-2]QEL21572.1 GFA family protein [Bosea sp. F3-2]
MAGDWKLPWAGGCRCGRTRISISAPPLLASACHCHGCQRMSASAFSLTLAVPAAGFAVTQGEPVLGGLKGATRHFFCRYCLSWMFTCPEQLDDLVNLRPSMLDDHGWFAPFVEVWTSHKLPWATTSAAHSFATQPDFPAYGALMAEYAEKGARPG